MDSPADKYAAWLAAAKAGDLLTVKKGKDGGIDINRVVDKEGLTALHLAASAGHVDVVAYLLAQGALVNRMDACGELPHEWACYSNRRAVCTLLLKHGARFNSRNISGETVLHYLAEWGELDACKDVCARGADVNATDLTGITPLHNAAEHGRRDICQVLLSAGANVNTADSECGRLPLACALGFGHISTCQLLVAHGATTRDAARLPGIDTDLSGYLWAARDGGWSRRMAAVNAYEWLRHHSGAVIPVAPPQGACRVCGVHPDTGTDTGAAVATFLCSACRLVYYCSATCQRAHWKAHKPACQAAVFAKKAFTPMASQVGSTPADIKEYVCPSPSPTP